MKKIFLVLIVLLLASYVYGELPPPEPGVDITVDPTAADFGSVKITNSSAAVTFTVGNIGTNSEVSLLINAVSLTGTDSADFGISSDYCTGQSLPLTKNCTVDVVFSPLTIGEKTAMLAVEPNDVDTPVFYATLTGIGLTNNNSPSAPPLYWPEGGQFVSASSVTFAWGPSTDPDGDAVGYELYYSTDQSFTGVSPVIVASAGKPGLYISGLGVGLIVFGLVIAAGRGKRGICASLILVTFGIFAVSCGEGGGPTVRNEAQTSETTAVAAGKGNVEGTVKDYDTGAPLGGAVITIAGQPATASQDGYYIVKDVEEGNRPVSAVKSGYIGYSGTVSVLKDTTVVHHISMKAGYSYTVIGLTPGITYYWKVSAVDSKGDKTESDIRAFTTK